MPDDITHTGNHIVQLIGFGQDINIAALDLGEIQHIINQVEQVLATTLDGAQIFLTFFRQSHLFLQQLGITQYAVKRRAQLVADARQELAFRVQGILCGNACIDQILLHPFAISDINHDPHRTQRLVAVIVFHHIATAVYPAVVPGAVAHAKFDTVARGQP